MHDAFWWGTNVGEFLLSDIKIDSLAGLLGVCFFTGALSFFFEFLRFVQIKQKQKELKIRAKQIQLLCTTESSALLARTVENPENPLNITFLDRSLLIGTEISLWTLLQVLGYLLMLSIMYYDGWIMVSVVLGGGLGYFVFGQMFMKINLQNCRIIRDSYCTQICGEADKKEGETTPTLEPTTSHRDVNSSSNNCLQTSPQIESVVVHNEM